MTRAVHFPSKPVAIGSNQGKQKKRIQLQACGLEEARGVPGMEAPIAWNLSFVKKISLLIRSNK
jgi:hypothetical protein